jgi:Fic family protein
MLSFSSEFIKNLRFHPSSAWYISQCTEARGMQEMWSKIRPNTLIKLKESALIQSTESSNRIEGVEVERNRLIPLVLGKVRPRDRSEEEIAGYRKALNYIHKNYAKLKINSETIKFLHELAQGGMISDAGSWKEKDNDIIEILPNGERIVRFIPIKASQTAKAMEQLCLGFNDLIQNSQLPELAVISLFILDFLCIHPFRDGNGRVSRLLTLLLLNQYNYEVGKFISLERIIENSKVDYYRVLKLSSEEWHHGQHDILPWLNYFLSTIKEAYQELKERVSLVSEGDSQSSMIIQTIKKINGEFSLSDIQKINPQINRELIKKVLFQLKSNGKIKLIGAGRASRWKNV